VQSILGWIFNIFHFYIPFTNVHGKLYAKMCLINGFLKGTLKRITFKTNKKTANKIVLYQYT